MRNWLKYMLLLLWAILYCIGMNPNDRSREDRVSRAGCAGPGCACEDKSKRGVEHVSEGTRGGVMVSVPKGKFLMGCRELLDKHCAEDEKPSRSVFLDSFYIDKYEVTNSSYEDCVADGKCEPLHYGDGMCHIFKGSVSTPGIAPDQIRQPDRPAVCVNWQEAKDFCKWAGKRLPTEAEWEKAARGTDGRIYPWGDEWEPEWANYCDDLCDNSWRDRNQNDGHRFSAVPGSYSVNASPYGAMDMAGNVWEWVEDTYEADYYKSSPDKNPAGPPLGYVKSIRGGGWNDINDYLRTSNRHFGDPLERTDIYGFRCAK